MLPSKHLQLLFITQGLLGSTFRSTFGKDIYKFILECKVLKIKIKFCIHLHFYNNTYVPSGNQKLYTCGIDVHLGQIQEIQYIM